MIRGGGGYVIYADGPLGEGGSQRIFWGGKRGWFIHWRNAFLYQNPLYAVKSIARNRKNWRHADMFCYARYASIADLEQGRVP